MGGAGQPAVDAGGGGAGADDDAAVRISPLAAQIPGRIWSGVQRRLLLRWLGHQSLADTQCYVELVGAHRSWVAKL